MESAGGKVCGAPVEPLTTETPSIRNSLLSVRLPSIESCEELRPPWLVMSPPEETPGVRARRFRVLRLGSGRSCNWDGVMVLPSDELSDANWPSRSAFHGYGLGHFARLHHDEDVRPLAHRQLDAGDLLMLEALGRHVDVVASGRQIGRPIDAVHIGLTGPGDDAGIGIGNGDGGSSDGGLRGGDDAGNHAVDALAPGERAEQRGQESTVREHMAGTADEDSVPRYRWKRGQIEPCIVCRCDANTCGLSARRF